jgi:hypothetical protein
MSRPVDFEHLRQQGNFIISAMPPTEVASLAELDLGRAAALAEQYLRIYAPGNRRRVFTGRKGVQDNSADYHAAMATLNDTALAIGRELKQALQGRHHWSDEEVHRRAELRKAIKTMVRHNHFFDNVPAFQEQELQLQPICIAVATCKELHKAIYALLYSPRNDEVLFTP